MLEHDRFDLSKGIDVNKTDGLHEYIIWYYWYFIETKFKFQLEVRNVYHDLTQEAKSFNDVAIVSVKRNGYRIHFLYMIKDKATNLLKKCWFEWKKSNIIKSKKYRKITYIYINMDRLENKIIFWKHEL